MAKIPRDLEKEEALKVKASNIVAPFQRASADFAKKADRFLSALATSQEQKKNLAVVKAARYGQLANKTLNDFYLRTQFDPSLKDPTQIEKEFEKSVKPLIDSVNTIQDGEEARRAQNKVMGAINTFVSGRLTPVLVNKRQEELNDFVTDLTQDAKKAVYNNYTFAEMSSQMEVFSDFVDEMNISDESKTKLKRKFRKDLSNIMYDARYGSRDPYGAIDVIRAFPEDFDNPAQKQDDARKRYIDNYKEFNFLEQQDNRELDFKQEDNFDGMLPVISKLVSDPSYTVAKGQEAKQGIDSQVATGALAKEHADALKDMLNKVDVEINENVYRRLVNDILFKEASPRVVKADIAEAYRRKSLNATQMSKLYNLMKVHNEDAVNIFPTPVAKKNYEEYRDSRLRNHFNVEVTVDGFVQVPPKYRDLYARFIREKNDAELKAFNEGTLNNAKMYEIFDKTLLKYGLYSNYSIKFRAFLTEDRILRNALKDMDKTIVADPDSRDKVYLKSYEKLRKMLSSKMLNVLRESLAIDQESPLWKDYMEFGRDTGLLMDDLDERIEKLKPKPRAKE